MKVDTAERLTERALQISDDLNEMVRDAEETESGEELARLREAIRRVMWSVYFEILKPAFEEHPSLEVEADTGASPATKKRRARPSAHRRASSSAPEPRRSPPMRESGRQRVR